MRRGLNCSWSVLGSAAVLWLCCVRSVPGQSCADFAKAMVELEDKNQLREKPLVGPGDYWYFQALKNGPVLPDLDMVYEHYLKMCQDGAGNAPGYMESEVARRQQALARTPDMWPPHPDAVPPAAAVQKCAEQKAKITALLDETVKVQAELIRTEQQIDAIPKTVSSWIRSTKAMLAVFEPDNPGKADDERYAQQIAERAAARIKEKQADIVRMTQRQDALVKQIQTMRTGMESLKCGDVP